MNRIFNTNHLKLKEEIVNKAYMKPYMFFHGSEKRINHIRHKRHIKEEK